MTSEELRKLLDEATPGPWISEAKHGPQGPYARATVGVWSQVKYDEALTFGEEDPEDEAWLLGVFGQTDAEDIANARLIAAAPDLAAELIRVRQERDELRKALAKYVQTDGVGDGRISCFDCYDNFAAARAILARWGA